MDKFEILKGKRILAVDDEPDVLEVIEEQLEDCELVTAGDFDTAHRLLVTETFDLVLLDIMGVNGFALLDTCRERSLPAAILTAHATNFASLNLSMKLGAVSFLPKEQLSILPELVSEILECVSQGQSHWAKLFQRLGPLFKEKLGVEWKDLSDRPYPLSFK